MKYYLDSAASAKLLPPEVVKQPNIIGNPNSTHTIGREAKSILEEARESLASYFQINPHGVIFTSTATEANNLFVNSFDEVHCSNSEHPSVFNCKNTIKSVSINSQGVIQTEVISHSLKSQNVYSLIHLNNETGVIVDYQKLPNSNNRQSIIHLDCSQSGNWHNIKNIFSYVDAITLSSHKCGGPFGASALLISEKILQKKFIKPQMIGGGQEYQHRAGTQNVSAIVGFVNSFVYSQKNVLTTLNNAKQLEEKLCKILTDSNVEFEYLCHEARKSPSIMSIWFKKCRAEELQSLLDMQGVFVSLGSACKSGANKESPIFKEMGLPKESSKETIRISFGWNTTIDEVEQSAKIIASTVGGLT